MSAACWCMAISSDRCCKDKLILNNQPLFNKEGGFFVAYDLDICIMDGWGLDSYVRDTLIDDGFCPRIKSKPG